MKKLKCLSFEDQSVVKKEHEYFILEKFTQGSMVPPFDKVVFDPNTKLKTVLGPVQTHFGWHLIYIEDRQGV